MSCLTAVEYVEWRAFDRLEPIGLQRGDYQAALIATVVANAMARDKDVHPEAYKLEDFLLKWGDEDEEERSNPLLEKVLNLNMLLGGRDTR